MRAWRRSGSTWLGRLAHGLWLDRNPLRRRSDRAETAMLGVLLTAFLASAPFVAHAAGSWTYTTSAREAQAQQETLHQVRATLLQPAAWSISEGGAEAQARWKAPDGQTRTGQVFVPSGAPVAAHAAGSWTYATSAREAQAQQAARHQVPATLLQSATLSSISGGGAEAQARWKAPDGQMRTGQIFVTNGGPAGSTVMVWVNQAGQLTGAPLQHSQVTGRAVMARVLAVAALAVTLIIVGWAAHWALERRRLAAWDAEWLTTEPRWSPRR